MHPNQVKNTKKYRVEKNRCSMQVDRAMRDRFATAANKLGFSKAEAFELCTKYLESKII
jgi:hypothetical protein